VFQCYTAEILVIGYGDKFDDEVNQQAILYPIASMEKIIVPSSPRSSPRNCFTVGEVLS